MQSLGTSCVGIGIVAVAAATYAPIGMWEEPCVVMGIFLVPLGLLLAVLGRKPNQPV